jgi:hypothetical protein
LTTISTSVFSEGVSFSSVVISTVSSIVTGISSVDTSDGLVSSTSGCDKIETTISIDVEESQREGFEISISTGEFHVPEIIKELTSLKIAEGNELVLTVEYVSQPESVVTWFIDSLLKGTYDLRFK